MHNRVYVGGIVSRRGAICLVRTPMLKQHQTRTDLEGMMKCLAIAGNKGRALMRVVRINQLPAVEGLRQHISNSFYRAMLNPEQH